MLARAHTTIRMRSASSLGLTGEYFGIAQSCCRLRCEEVRSRCHGGELGVCAPAGEVFLGAEERTKPRCGPRLGVLQNGLQADDEAKANVGVAAREESDDGGVQACEGGIDDD
eukprot:4559090-Prymnesium_polylepis.1